jgi:RNA-binding protein 39
MDLDILLIQAAEAITNVDDDDKKSKKKRDRSSDEDEDGRRKKRRRRSSSGRSKKKKKEEGGDLTDQDARTLFVYNLSTSVGERDVKKFFEQVGKVRDVKLIGDRHSRKTKGFGYVEMASIDHVVDAIRLSGQKLNNKPVMVQASQGEKNTVVGASNSLGIPEGPCCIYISSLNRIVTEEDLRREFEPYGEIDSIILHRDPDTGMSKGYAHVIYKRPEYAKRAQLQVNGRELAGKTMRTRVIETPNLNNLTSTLDDGNRHMVKDKEMRTQLMAKLQRNDDSLNELGQSSSTTKNAILDLNNLPSKCIVMRNMFDPSTEKTGFEIDIEDDIRKELIHFGSVKHIYVDKYNSKGCVYVRFASEGAAMGATKRLNGRWYNQKRIEISYIPQKEYLERFPPGR